MLDKKFLWFVIKFLLLFGVLYVGTLGVIGLAAPGKYYSPFVAQYLDYVSWIKNSLMWSAGIFCGWFGYETYQMPGFILRIKSGAGVLIAMSCVGYGVYSFWTAYVIANDGNWRKKFLWVTGGLLLLWIINSIRIAMVLISIHEKRPMPLGIDHHTWFNIVAYIFIFSMIWLFERQGRQLKNGKDVHQPTNHFNNNNQQIIS
ncbi:MAG: exosortase/archaeosortase family protein [Chitinophagaceae bacterium]|nr:MAG: exosortase/archaeosortase family protein [Chitinophagaceae bacterium]